MATSISRTQVDNIATIFFSKMAQLQIPSILSFDPHGDPNTTSQRWEKWKKSLGYFITASGITDDNRKQALLLHLIGEETQDIFETYPADKQGSANNYDCALELFNLHFKVKKNIPYERSTFNRAKQQPGEHLLNNLLTLYSEFGESVDDHFRDRIIDGCTSNKLKHKLLTEENLTIQKTIELEKTKDNADRQLESIENQSLPGNVEEANEAKHYNNRKTLKKKNHQKQQRNHYSKINNRHPANNNHQFRQHSDLQNDQRQIEFGRCLAKGHSSKDCKRRSNFL